MNEIIRNQRCSQRSATPFRFEQGAESGDMKMSPIDSNCIPRDYIKEITGVCDGDLAAETLCSAAAALSKRVEMRSDKFYCENLVLRIFS